jgi:TRAP-type transport system periplasmic protein
MTFSLSRAVMTVLATLSLAASAHAATLKIATLAPEGSSWMREMRAAGDALKAGTEGRVELKFFPGGVMGNGETVLR